MTESQAYFILNLLPSIGAVTVRAGIEAFGSAAAFLQAPANRLTSIRGVGPDRANAIRNALTDTGWEQQLAKAQSSGVTILTPADEAYPPLLRTIHSPPLALYVAGDPAVLSKTALAMVGTRAPTLYGRDTARLFAARLSQAGLVIVSGLALGIDAEAAEGALQSHGKTVAVIGSGLDRVYPTENRGLARRICKEGGAVISEYPFGRSADRQTFPMRNRIIAGLSSGVLCVEAGVHSGTLITADAALEQGRSVMAIPGRITDASALGCLRLIKNGARLVDCPEDVLDELSSLPGFAQNPASSAAAPAAALPQPPKPAAPRLLPIPEHATPGERRILECLTQTSDPLSADELQRETGLPAAELPPLLIALEMKCLLRRTPGNLYTR